jgi:hypothetical protein
MISDPKIATHYEHWRLRMKREHTHTRVWFLHTNLPSSSPKTSITKLWLWESLQLLHPVLQNPITHLHSFQLHSTISLSNSIFHNTPMLSHHFLFANLVFPIEYNRFCNYYYWLELETYLLNFLFVL